MAATATALDIKDIPVEQAELYQPPLDDVAKVLLKSLLGQFTQVTVEVVDCPDLTQQPFTLACKGLGGNRSIVEVGGVPYLLPNAMKNKLYDLRDVASLVGLDKGFITGAGAGPWPYANTNCEMMVNMEVEGRRVRNLTRIARVLPESGLAVQEVLPDSESRHAVLSNLYCSEGRQERVLRVHCKGRTGKDDFVTCLRKALLEEYKEKSVGLGGVFLLSAGKAKQHVMPDFSTVPLETEEALNNWLRFYEMSAPLVAVGTLVTADPGLDLRLQHFHSFSHHGEGGHYHNDTTPQDAEYQGYFALGQKIYRLDRPTETHSMGRD